MYSIRYASVPVDSCLPSLFAARAGKYSRATPLAISPGTAPSAFVKTMTVRPPFGKRHFHAEAWQRSACGRMRKFWGRATSHVSRKNLQSGVDLRG
jgi:hypothetical protein